MNWLTTFGTYASAIAAVIGLISACVYKPLKNLYTTYKADVQASKDADALILQRLGEVDKKVNSLTDDVQMIEGDRLAQKHQYYVSRGFASAAEKQDVARWYTSYTGKGGNHLVSTYMDDIMALPEELRNE